MVSDNNNIERVTIALCEYRRLITCQTALDMIFASMSKEGCADSAVVKAARYAVLELYE